MNYAPRQNPNGQVQTLEFGSGARKGTEVLLQIGPFFFSKIHLFIRLSIFFGSYMVMITLLSSMSFSVIDSGVCFVINVPHESNAFAFCLCRLCSYPPQLLDRLGTPTGS